MRLTRLGLLMAPVPFCASLLAASILGGVRGIIHDPQHRPVAGAAVTIRARNSAWSQAARSNPDGEFQFDAVPVGEYVVAVAAPDFSPVEELIVVTSAGAPVLHFQLKLAIKTEAVEVTAAPELVNPESSTTQAIVSREEIARAPGADRSNSLAMITDFVPGATIVHDQLHLRGGHQVSWLVDGVPVPNSSIASNVGPQFDPKDIDYVEIQRGGYSAEYGDRTFGVFNVVTRTGFERNNEGELVASYGSFRSTDDQVSFASHTSRFAYYASANANRSSLGLLTPSSAVIHDMRSGLGGFASFIFNVRPSDQLRFVTSLRRDHYQIPNRPEDQAAGIRDLDRESDALAAFSWVHTAGQGVLLTVSPFYHFNRADLAGGAGDTPLVPDDNRASNYVGAQASLGIVRGKHAARFGALASAQHDDASFALRATDGTGLALAERQALWGNLTAAFLEDRFKLTSWLTLNGGVRLTRFSASLDETSADPRLGAAIQVPRLGWVVRGFYGRYYQAPPLDTVSGPLLQFALQRGFGYLPLHGERDEQHDFGLSIPFRNWVIDLDNFRTGARNFFDHDVLGSSNIFFPLTIARARIRGWEATLRSPMLYRRARLHLVYSRQTAQARGAVTGGLTDFSAPPGSYFFLDHDQRHTLSSLLSLTLPRRAWASVNVAYGSGFLDGNGPRHLPAYTTFDVSLGKQLGERWSLAVSALNAANRRYLLDNSNTFGGTHYAYPRQLSLELRYRFHY